MLVRCISIVVFASRCAFSPLMIRTGSEWNSPMHSLPGSEVVKAGDARYGQIASVRSALRLNHEKTVKSVAGAGDSLRLTVG